MTQITLMTALQLQFPNNQMQSTPEPELKITQAVKLFHLIQQISSDTIHHITSKDLQHITSIWRQGHNFNPIIFQSLNPTRKQLTEDHFGFCVSQFLKEYLSSCQDLVSFNRDMKSMLLGQYVQKSKIHQVLRQQFNITLFDTTAEKQYEEQVARFHMDIRYALSISFDSQVVKKINYIVASIFHSYQWFKELCQDALCDYLRTGFLDIIIKEPATPTLLEDYYKCFLFMTEANKFESISKCLASTEFFSHKAWNSFLLSYFNISNAKGIEIVQTRSTIFAFIANYISICIQFIDFLIGWMSTSQNQATLVLLPSNLNPQQSISVWYNIYIFTKLIRRSKENELNNKPTLAEVNVRDIEAFAMKILTNGTAQTVNSSIQLLSQTVKFSLGNYYNERNVGFILMALETNPIQYPLVKIVMLVFENALKFDNKDVAWIFVKNQKCMRFLKEQLLLPFEGPNNVHCQCLEILYYMAQPKYILSFQEYSLLDTLLETAKKNNLLLTIISKIILKVIQVTSANKMWNIISMKQTIVLLTYLFQFVGIKKDPVMQFFLNAEFPYLNKQIFFNIIKSLYRLSDTSIRSQKKFFEEDTEGILSLNILKELTNLVIWMKSSDFGKRLLKEKINIKQDDESMKIFKLIFIIGEQLLRAHRDKGKQLKITLFNSRNNLQAALYSVLELRQLQTENIPLYIEYQFRYDSRFNNSFVRQFISTIQYNIFKEYILDVFNQRLIKQGQQSVNNIYFIDQLHAHQKIRTEQQFKSLIRRCQNKKQNEYRVALRILTEQSVVSQQPSLNNPLTVFNNQSNQRTLRVSPHSHRIQDRGRSRSPFRQTTSGYMSERTPTHGTSNPSNIRLCQDCGINRTTGRLCNQCNSKI